MHEIDLLIHDRIVQWFSMPSKQRNYFNQYYLLKGACLNVVHFQKYWLVVGYLTNILSTKSYHFGNLSVTCFTQI